MTLSLLLVLCRGGKFFFQQSYLLAGKLCSGLALDHNALAGQGFDRPVHCDIQVFGRLKKPFGGCFRHLK